MGADGARSGATDATAVPRESPAGRTAWSARVPPEPRSLDDRHLLDYRDRYERPALALAVGLVVLITIVLLRVNDTVAAVVLAIIALWGAMLVYDLVQEVQLLANGAEVTPTQCSDLYPIVEELRQRWAVPRTRVLVVFQPGLGAVSYGFKEPYMIRVDSQYASSLDEAELRYVLGREMAHIKFGHTRWWMLLGGTDREVPGVLQWLAKPRNLIFAWWRRAQRTSADRAGILACGDVGRAISALVKYQVGPSVAQQVSVDGLGMQAAELTHGWERLMAFFGQMLVTEPFLLYRIRLMVEWAGLPVAGTVLSPAPDGSPPLAAPVTQNASREEG
jgi:Zn-dependent protease with chaperone function